MSQDNEHKEIDEISGVETTGHEWDGIKELNNPMPRWWLYIFYATIAVSVVYWVLYPAWPLINSHTTGILGQSDRANVQVRLQELQAMRGERGAALITSSLEEIRTNPDLLTFAMAQGRAAFGDNCAPCHGSGAQGFPGYPNLNDDAWIWGGSLDELYHTIAYGIRSTHPDTRMGEMLAFGRLGILRRDEIADVVHYVRQIAELPVHSEEGAGRGAAIFQAQCASCHGADGRGIREVGAPNLTDSVWLFGSGYPEITTSVRDGRAGVMPHWQGRLDETTLKALTVYVHSLGGGE